MLCRFRIFMLMTVCMGTLASAQDARTVVEPSLPPVCTTLDAQLVASGRSLAEADEQKLDTARIQKAMDKCGKGRGVVLHVHGSANAFLSGPLELRPGVTLIVDRGVTLYGSRDAALFAVAPGSCGVVNHAPEPRGCTPLIAWISAPARASWATARLMARGGEKILGSQLSWWEMANRRVTAAASRCRGLLVADDSDNFTLYRITLKNSPNFHVAYNHGNGFTVWGVKIDTPQRFADGPHPLSRNTDGIDPGNGTKNVTITHSFIRDGDDNIAIKGGPGGADGT